MLADVADFKLSPAMFATANGKVYENSNQTHKQNRSIQLSSKFFNVLLTLFSLIQTTMYLLLNEPIKHEDNANKQKPISHQRNQTIKASIEDSFLKTEFEKHEQIRHSGAVIPWPWGQRTKDTFAAFLREDESTLPCTKWLTILPPFNLNINFTASNLIKKSG